MKGLLVRVGADQTEDGGEWNGPVDTTTGKFVYVSIIEDDKKIKRRFAKPYKVLGPALKRLGCSLPEHLDSDNMHLDPDFEYLTYGDHNRRATQIEEKKLGPGDILVFYAGLRDIHLPKKPKNLVYAIIGIYVIQEIVKAKDVPAGHRHENAHTRVVPGETDIVVRAQPGNSGRLGRCIPIGCWRDNAYRVCPAMRKAWGGLSTDFIQRSVYLPKFLDARRFYAWFQRQRIPLIPQNNE